MATDLQPVVLPLGCTLECEFFFFPLQVDKKKNSFSDIVHLYDTLALSDGSQANHGLVSRIGHLLLSGSLPVLQHRGGVSSLTFPLLVYEPGRLLNFFFSLFFLGFEQRLPRTGITLPTFRFLPFGRNMDGIHIFGPPNLGPALVLETMEKSESLIFPAIILTRPSH